MATPLIFLDENPFYRQKNYLKSTRLALDSPIALDKVTHYYNTEINIERFAIKVACLLIPPYGLYKTIHLVAGMTAILPAATPALLDLPRNHANQARSEIRLKKNWKLKRITIKTNGNRLDALIMGKTRTLANKRWVLYSGGNSMFCETSIRSRSLKKFLELTKSNLIVFNYPSVGCSTGTVTRKTLTMAYRAVLHFLEDPLAIGATEIIAYGFSLGAAVQGEVLRRHRLKPRIKYVFIKSRSFSELSAAATQICSRSLGVITKLFNWNLRPIESSLRLSIDEIILQTGNVFRAVLTTDETLLSETDGIIHRSASLAQNMLADPNLDTAKKRFIFVPENHNTELGTHSTQLLATETLAILSKAS